MQLLYAVVGKLNEIPQSKTLWKLEHAYMLQSQFPHCFGLSGTRFHVLLILNEVQKEKDDSGGPHGKTISTLCTSMQACQRPPRELHHR